MKYLLFITPVYLSGILLDNGKLTTDGTVLGRGAFGYVIGATRQATEDSPEMQVALKLLDERYDAVAVRAEIDALSILLGSPIDHPGKKNILKCFGCFKHEIYRVFTFELLGISLADLLKMNGDRGMKMSDVKRVARELLQALDHCHRCGVIHTDLKPNNVLLSHRQLVEENGLFMATPGNESLVKLIDFGSARVSEEGDEHPVTTAPYRSPEAILYIKWTSKTDIWSLGCLLVELFMGGRLFPICDEHEALHVELIRIKLSAIPGSMIERASRSFGRRLAITSTVLVSQFGLRALAAARSLDSQLLEHPAFLWFVQRMLELDPEDRATATESLADAFLTIESGVTV